MAPLQVIGAGVSRTGTDSLRTALNMLGYNTHHFKCMIGIDRNPEAFTEAYLHPEKHVDWDAIYDGFDAAVDWPTASFIKPLIDKYPDAKVVLTVRDADSWYQSVKKTIFTQFDFPVEQMPELMRRNLEMYIQVSFGGVSGNPEMRNDTEKMKRIMIEHNAWVKSFVPPERLLVMELGEGWDRLCAFLNKPAPDKPYPWVNTTEEMLKTMDHAFQPQQNRDLVVSANVESLSPCNST